MTKLTALIEERGHKIKFICMKTGISEYRMGFIRADESKMTAVEMIALAEFFGMTAEEFAERVGIKPELVAEEISNF